MKKNIKAYIGALAIACAVTLAFILTITLPAGAAPGVSMDYQNQGVRVIDTTGTNGFLVDASNAVPQVQIGTNYYVGTNVTFVTTNGITIHIRNGVVTGQ